MIFVADIHIQPGVKGDSDRFIRWLAEGRQGAERVYVLGDLFNYWFTGIEAELKPVLEALKHPGISIVPGNRDFLLSNLSQPGITVLHEEEIITGPASQKILLAHGHTLTRGDYGFALLHSLGWPVLKLLDRALPPSIKERVARFLVTSSAVIRPPLATIDPGMAKKRGVDMVICGHLHRPVMLEHLIVLPPFFDTGQWLVWDEHGFSIKH